MLPNRGIKTGGQEKPTRQVFPGETSRQPAAQQPAWQ